MFVKTLIVSDFDKNLTQSVAHNYVSKYFLPLHFAVGQMLSKSCYDLEEYLVGKNIVNKT